MALRVDSARTPRGLREDSATPREMLQNMGQSEWRRNPRGVLAEWRKPFLCALLGGADTHPVLKKETYFNWGCRRIVGEGAWWAPIAKILMGMRGHGAMADASVDMTRLQGCNSGVAPRQPDATNFCPTAAWISVMRLPESGVTPSVGPMRLTFVTPQRGILWCVCQKAAWPRQGPVRLTFVPPQRGYV